LARQPCRRACRIGPMQPASVPRLRSVNPSMLRKPASLFVSVTGLLFLILGPAVGQENPAVSQALMVLKPRCIGPANMSGRVVDVAVYEKEPRIMYVASASGGLWKTVNH